MKRIAFFLRITQQFAAPAIDAMIRCLLQYGAKIDVYAPNPPDGTVDPNRYGDSVRILSYSAGRKWILRNASRFIIRRYSFFVATTENPVITAGVLSLICRRPLVVQADEIFSGSYSGDAPAFSKRLARWFMKRSALTIVSDPSRIELQRCYAGMSPSSEIIVYPNALLFPPKKPEKPWLREKHGIPEDQCVLIHSGSFSRTTAASWIIACLKNLPRDTMIFLQHGGTIDSILLSALKEHQCHDRLFIFDEFLKSYEECTSLISLGDIGLVFYDHDGPQFMNMGISSTKLCMFLSVGIPVIATRQPSFNFIEQENCGVLIDSEEKIPQAVESIRKNYDVLSRNAYRAWERTVSVIKYYNNMCQALEAFVSH